MPVHRSDPAVADGGAGVPLRIPAEPEVVIEGVRFLTEQPDADHDDYRMVFVGDADGQRRARWVRKADLFR